MSQRPRAEIVYLVKDYYDGPESGFADFRGQPHRFDVIEERMARDRQIRRFRLYPVEEGLLRLALEQQRLWSRWNASYRKGELPDELPYPERVLPDDLEEYRALEARMREWMAKLPEAVVSADGRFFAGRRSTVYGAFGESFRVVWSRCRPAA
jgi:hypothetical protein